MAKGLNDKQARFVEEYCIDFNATGAAVRAGYSEKTAAVQAHKLLKQKKIQAEVAKKKQKLAKKVDLSAELVLRELLIIAKADVRDFEIDDNGKIQVIGDVSHDAGRAISSVKVTKRFSKEGDHIGTTSEFKLWSKDRALENLGKHLAMFTEKQQISGDPENPTPAVMLYLPRNGKTADEQ